MHACALGVPLAQAEAEKEWNYSDHKDKEWEGVCHPTAGRPHPSTLSKSPTGSFLTMVNEPIPALVVRTLPRKKIYGPKDEGHTPSGSGVLQQLHIDFEGAASSEANRGGSTRLLLLKCKKGTWA